MSAKPIPYAEVASSIWAMIEQAPADVQLATLGWIGGAINDFPPQIERRRKMTKRLIESDPCFVKAMPDEPAFVLLARDPMAPALVRLWVAARRIAIAEGGRPISDLSQVEAAEREAEYMEQWRRDAEGSWRAQHSLQLTD